MGAKGPPRPVSDWERSERSSFWVALAIALVPIPISLLIAWALGSPLRYIEPSTDHGDASDAAPADPGMSGPHGRR